jgi:hypothetical protein
MKLKAVKMLFSPQDEHSPRPRKEKWLKCILNHLYTISNTTCKYINKVDKSCFVISFFWFFVEHVEIYNNKKLTGYEIEKKSSNLQLL